MNASVTRVVRATVGASRMKRRVQLDQLNEKSNSMSRSR